MTPVRVLLLDDNPYDRRLIIRELKRELGTIVAQEVFEEEGFVRALADPCFDVVITDHQLRWTTGLEVLRRVKARCPDVPVIMFTGTGNEEIAVEGMKAGLDDYILKTPRHFRRLSAAVRRALEVTAQRRQVQELQQEYRHLFEEVPLGLFRIRLDGSAVRANPAMREILRIPPDRPLETVRPEDIYLERAEYERFLQRVLEQGEARNVEGQIRRLDGERFWARVSARLVRDEGGRPIAIDGLVEDVTKERERRQRLQWLSTAMEAAANAILLTDVKGTILWVNPAFTKMTGYTAEEIIGREPRILKSGQQDETFYRTLWNTILSGRVWQGELVNRRKDGTFYTEEMTITPVRGEAGTITHFIAFKQDVTARKRIEEELQHVNRTLRLLTRAVEAVLRAEDEPSLLQDVVEAAVEVGGYVLAWIGYPSDDRVRRVVPMAWAGKESGYLASVEITWADVEHGRGPTGQAIRGRRAVVCQDILHDPAFEPWRQEALRRGYASSASIPIVWKEKVLGTLNVYATEPFRFDEEEVVLLSMMADDLAYGLTSLRTRTERDRAVSDLTRWAEQLEALNTIVGKATRAEDLATLLKDVIRSVVSALHVPFAAIWVGEERELYGLPREAGAEMLRWAQEYALDIPDVIAHSDFSRVKGKTPLAAFLPRVTRQLGIRAAATAPITTRGKRIGGLSVADRKPREWTKEEIELLRSVGRQIGAVAWRLHLLGELKETNIRLEDALRLRDEMIQNVSHELRTPLTIIMGYVELLQGEEFGPLSEEQQHIAKILLRNAQRLHFMVERLLLLRTLPEKKIQKIPLRLASWLPALVDDWRLRAEEANVILKVIVAPGLPPVPADPRLLEEVINNLIHNAVKFSPQGGIITLRAYSQGDEAIIAISDQGIGIPKDKLDKIWERFYQVDQGTARRYEGMGIGLALCQEIVAKHGGRIWAESEGRGKGSTFYVALPYGQDST